MSTSLQSLIDCGTKLYLDSVDPDLVKQNIEWGAGGGHEQPGYYQWVIGGRKIRMQSLRQAAEKEPNDEAIAWQLTDQVRASGLSKLSIRFGKSRVVMRVG